MAKFILCLDKLGTNRDDASLFVEAYVRRDDVEIECYDTKEKASINKDLFFWMLRKKILTEY